MAFGFGRIGDMFGHSTVGKKIMKTAANSNMNSKFARLGKSAHKNKNMTEAAMIASGKRRAVTGAGVVAGAFAMNQGIGPNGNRSTARSGIRPRSTGGYA